jgi:predicted nucleic acid-binding protein
MIHLLDVNALVALGFVNHEFHDRVVSWIREQNSPTLATCSITELGFVRAGASPVVQDSRSLRRAPC